MAIRSNPIPCIKDNQQLSAIKLAFCYQYKTGNGTSTGSHTYAGTGVNKSLRVNIYGIDKTGATNLIAYGDLETTATYLAMTPAASVITGIPVKEYPWIYWSYDQTQATDFSKFIGRPEMFVEVREYPDVLDTTVYTPAILS